MGDLGDWKNIRAGWEGKFNFGVDLDLSTDSAIKSPYRLSDQHGFNLGYALPFHKNFHLIPEFTWNTSILTREIKGDGTSTLDNKMYTLGVVLNIPVAFTETPHEIALRIPLRGVLNMISGKGDIGSSELAALDLTTGGFQTGLEISYCGAKFGWNMNVIAAPSFDMGDYVEGATSLATLKGYPDSIYHSMAVGLDAGDVARCIAGHVNASSGPDPVADANEKLDTLDGALTIYEQRIAAYRANTTDSTKRTEAESQYDHCRKLQAAAVTAKNAARDTSVDSRYTQISTRFAQLKSQFDAIATPPPPAPDPEPADPDPADAAPAPSGDEPPAPPSPAAKARSARTFLSRAEAALAQAKESFEKKAYSQAKSLAGTAKVRANLADRDARAGRIGNEIKAKTDPIRASVTELLGKITATIAEDKARAAAAEEARRKAAEKPAEPKPPPVVQPRPPAPAGNNDPAGDL